MIKIPENMLTVLKAFLPLLVVVILFIIVGQFGFGKISDIRSEIETAKSDQKILTQKLDILRRIEGNGEQSSNLVVTALPESNPSLLVTSQVRILAGKNGLTVGSLKASSPAAGTTGLSSVNISFNIMGSRSQIETFIKEVGSIAPITIVDRIKITESGPGTSMGGITLKSFWAPFPTKVPAVSQALTDFTPAEQQTLEELRSLTQPIFSQIPASTSSSGKSDPFAP
jgi:Tfp pilus assembly protein PilO